MILRRAFQADLTVAAFSQKAAYKQLFYHFGSLICQFILHKILSNLSGFAFKNVVYPFYAVNSFSFKVHEFR